MTFWSLYQCASVIGLKLFENSNKFDGHSLLVSILVIIGKKRLILQHFLRGFLGLRSTMLKQSIGLLVCLQIASIWNLKSLHQIRPPTETAHWFRIYCIRDKSVTVSSSQIALKNISHNTPNKHLLKIIITTYPEVSLSFFTFFTDLIHKWGMYYDYSSD